MPTVRTLTGLDTSGDGGLLDLALSPTYAEDNLIYAYITTATDNRVVDFTLTGPVTPVVTGIPKGRTGNTGRLAFDADGELYIGTGDAGRPPLAAEPGQPGRQGAAGRRHRRARRRATRARRRRCSPAATTSSTGCARSRGRPPSSRSRTASNGSPDEINVLVRRRLLRLPRRELDAAHAAGRAAVRATRRRAAAPCVGNRLYVTSLDGTGAAVGGVHRHPAGAQARRRSRSALKAKYGRLRTVVAAPDGALWLTTSNRDGQGKPVAADERVIRYVPQRSAGATAARSDR